MSDTSLPPFLESLTPDSSVPYVNALFPASNDVPPVHVHWWPCKQAGVLPCTVFLFIPGNPGVIDFYSPFLTAIHNKDESGTLAILTHSHIGHDPAVELASIIISRNPSNYALPFQIRNALRVFDALSTWVGVNTRIVIAGHSVGSWVALQVLKLRSTTVPEFSYFSQLSPIFLARRMVDSCRLRFFQPPLPRVISLVARALRFTPLAILCRLFPKYPVSQVHVLRSFLLSPSSIFAAMTMAHDEMLSIRELDIAALNKYHEQIWFYFAEKDDWVGHGRDVILQVFRAGPSTMRVVHGYRDIPHAFCINHHDSEAVAAQCYDWLVLAGFL